MSLKPIVAVDIDEVLLPHFQDLANWYNKQYGTNLKMEDNQKHILSAWGVSEAKTAIKRVHKFLETEEFKQAKPFVEAAKVLAELSENYDLVILTGRDDIVKEFTVEWLNEHFGGLFKEVHFTHKYSLDGKMRSKAVVAKERSFSFLIDDELEHAVAASNAGVKVLLFGAYPWNRTDRLPKNVTRTANWAEVKEYFNNV